MHIFLPFVIKYHKIREYSRGKWLTVSLFFTTFMANLSTALSDEDEDVDLLYADSFEQQQAEIDPESYENLIGDNDTEDFYGF